MAEAECAIRLGPIFVVRNSQRNIKKYRGLTKSWKTFASNDSHIYRQAPISSESQAMEHGSTHSFSVTGSS
ncbi:MAG TPA: hypothetical protein DCP63_01235 [Bacteroidetes bacterium]|nr:hypothetical protein [Bacteroidota bacterium]